MESLHPLIVHFPIALLLSAVAFELTALIVKRPILHRVSLWNLSLGTLAAGVAVLTGLRAEEVAKHSFEIWQVMALHERLGITTFILSLMVTAWRWRTHDQLTPRARAVTLAAMLAIATTVSVGGYLGGRLVYEFGVGGRFGATHSMVPANPP